MTDKIEVGDKVQLTKFLPRYDVAVGSEGIVRRIDREVAEVWSASQSMYLVNVPLTSLLKIRGAHPVSPRSWDAPVHHSPFPPASESKPTNPKDAIGSSKASLSVISGPVLFEMGGVMTLGSCKYGRHNARVAGVRHSVYFDAIMRHAWAWWEGQDTDPESGYHHLAHVMACCNIARDSMFRGNDHDDRPPKTSGDWVPQANGRVKQLLLKFPDPKPPHCETDE